jgi:APA family basic amino acid/polyamine antiporter
VWLVAPLGAAACVYVMTGLPTAAWIRFGVWMVLGAAIYFSYGFRKSRLARKAVPPPS